MIAAAPATNVTAGLAGFVVLFGLAVACWFLFRSMNRHLRNVRYEAGELTTKSSGTTKKDTSGKAPNGESAR